MASKNGVKTGIEMNEDNQAWRGVNEHVGKWRWREAEEN